jgi:hypothetical protein
VVRAPDTRPEPARQRGSNGGLIVTGAALAIVHRELITTLAARHKLPTVFPTASHSRRRLILNPIKSTSFGAWPATSIASSRAEAADAGAGATK